MQYFFSFHLRRDVENRIGSDGNDKGSTILNKIKKATVLSIRYANQQLNSSTIHRMQRSTQIVATQGLGCGWRRAGGGGGVGGGILDSTALRLPSFKKTRPRNNPADTGP